MKKVTLHGLPVLAQEVLARVPSEGTRAAIVALQGELGAGRHTFMQALARELGVSGPVQSPTYVLMKSYPINFGRFKKLVHIDAYRLDEPEQFSALKPEEFLADRAALVCIEWPERLEGVLPKPDLTLKFSSEGAKEGERFAEVV